MHLRHWLPLPIAAALLALPTVSSAVDLVGPFEYSQRVYNPANPATIARDGTLESASLASGNAEAGAVAVRAWSGDTQLGTRNVGGINLFLPAGTNSYIGLLKDWSIREASDAGGPWILYPKFQQDALIVMGFGDTDPATLPKAHGAIFNIEGYQTYNRLLLVLPWRWVQGGGSSWQLASFTSGNPIEAGLWAVPASKSLSQVAATPAAHRLAGLDDILGEIKPHIHTTSFKLQLLTGGAWQIVIDINNDGITDYAADSNQMSLGHKASPFTTMTERSGLIVSSRAAMGSGSGFVGRSDFNVAYRVSPTSAVAIPTNRRPLIVNAPATSRVSPTTIDGLAWSSAQTVTASGATIPGSPAAVSRIGPQIFYFDLPLSEEGPTSFSLIQSGTPSTVVPRSMNWVPVEMYRNESITIRANSSILLAYNGNCGPEIVTIDADGDGNVDFTTSGQQERFSFRYNTPGIYQAVAKMGTAIVGRATITVTGLTFPSKAACQVGFERTVDVQLGTTPVANVIFEPQDLLDAKVRVLQTSGSVVQIGVTPLRRGTPIVVARAVGSNALLGTLLIDEFTFTDTAASGMLLANGEGQGRTEMRPYVPGIFFNKEIFANRAEFEGGAKVLRSNTSDSTWSVEVDTTGEVVGVFDYKLFMPASETKYCMRGFFSQAASPEVDVSLKNNINGTPCPLKLVGGVWCVEEGTDEAEGNLNGATFSRTQRAENCVPKKREFHISEGKKPAKFDCEYQLILVPDSCGGATVLTATLPTLIGTSSCNPAATQQDVGDCSELEARFRYAPNDCDLKFPKGSDCEKWQGERCFARPVHTGTNAQKVKIQVRDCHLNKIVKEEEGFLKIVRCDIDGLTGSSDVSTADEVPPLCTSFNSGAAPREVLGAPLQVTCVAPAGTQVKLRIHSRVPNKVRVSTADKVSVPAGAITAAALNAVLPPDACIEKTITTGSDCRGTDKIYAYGIEPSGALGDGMIEVDVKEQRSKCDSSDVAVSMPESEAPWVVADTERTTTVKIVLREDATCKGYTERSPVHHMMVPKGGSNKMKAIIEPASAASLIEIKSSSTARATVAPSRATTSPQEVTVTGVAKGIAEIGFFAGSMRCAHFEADVKDRRDITVKVWQIVEANDDVQAIPLGRGLSGRPCIAVGPNGICNTQAAGDDQHIISIGRGEANAVCVTAGPDGVLQATRGGDDTSTGTTITTGPNGICETAKVADDLQVIPVGSGKPGAIAINTGLNGVADSTAAGDDIQIIALGRGEPGTIGVTFGPNAFRDTVAAVGDDVIAAGDIKTGPNGICETTANAIDIPPLNVPGAAELKRLLDEEWGSQANIFFTVTTETRRVNYDLNRDGSLQYRSYTAGGEWSVINRAAKEAVNINVYFVHDYTGATASAHPPLNEVAIQDHRIKCNVFEWTFPHEVGHILGRIDHQTLVDGIMTDGPSSTCGCKVYPDDLNMVNP